MYLTRDIMYKIFWNFGIAFEDRNLIGAETSAYKKQALGKLSFFTLSVNFNVIGHISNY